MTALETILEKKDCYIEQNFKSFFFSRTRNQVIVTQNKYLKIMCFFLL